MFNIGAKLLALAVFFLIAIVACSSDTGQSESEQGGSLTEESSQGNELKELPEPDSEEPEQNNAAKSSSGDNSEDALPAAQSGTDSASTTNNEEQKEPEEDKPTPEPTREPDVIPFASADEESRMVSLRVDERYAGGTIVNSGELGIAFSVPSDWLGAIPQGSPAFIMVSQVRPGLIIVTSQDSNSIDEILQALSQDLPIDEGVLLQPKEQPKVNGPWVEVAVTASDGVDVFNGYAMALVRKSGFGIFIAAMGPDSPDYYKDVATKIATSTRAVDTIVASDQSSTAPVANASDSSSLAKEWTDFLAGMRATYMSSYSSGLSGGFSDKTEYDFCSNGQFAQSGSSSLSIDTGGASAFSGGSSGGSGTWKIITQGEQVFLELSWNDGSLGQPRLEYIDSKTYLNGERYFITPDNTTCR